MITIVCPSRYRIDKKLIRQSAGEILASNSVPSTSVVNIVFVGTRKMKEIAITYKNEDVALPVLAFPYKEDALHTKIDVFSGVPGMNDIDTPMEDDTSREPAEILYGEIFLCYPQVVLLAAERGKKVDEMIDRLIEHGLMNILKDQSTPVRA